MSSRYRYLCLALTPLLLLTACSAPKVQSAPAFPPVPVSVAVAAQESLPIEIRAIGTVEPFETVQVKSQIAGELMKVHVTEGGSVNKGDLLFEIDPRPYRDALQQAEAALNRDQAQLHQAEANLARDTAQSKFSEAEAARNQELSKLGVVARSQSDQVRANSNALLESLRADQAAIESARAAIESDRSAIDRVKLDLTYCEIRSPISGRVGNLLLHAGNYVKANGDTTLIVINRLKPIFVSFGVPETHLSAIRQGNNKRKLPVQVSPQDAPGTPTQGVLTVIDNTVDPATGTIKLKATLQNESGILWPGQFVNVSLTLDTLRNATTVPAEAVQPGAQGQFVYVVKQDQTVESRPVTVGATVVRKAIIEKGVAPGETVVTDGQLLLRPGAHIRAVPASSIDARPL